MGTIPTIATFSAGSIVTSAYLNSIKAANDFWALTPRCYAYLSGAFSPATSVVTAVPLGAEVMDIVQSGDTPMHDNTTNNTRIVVRTAGKYEIAGQIEFATNATGARSSFVRLNAAGSGSGGTLLYQAVQGAVTGNFTTLPIIPFEVALNVGDYVEMFAYQTSGGALAVNTGQGQTFLRAKLTGA